MKFFRKLIISCLFFLLTILSYAQKEHQLLSRLDSLGESHFYQGNLDSSVYYFQRSADLADQLKEDAVQLEAYNWLFYLQIASDRLDSLDRYLAQMIPLAERLSLGLPKYADELSSFWNSKSYYHDLKGEFYQKIEGDKNALRCYEMSTEVDTSELAILYQNLGTALEQIGDYYQAKTYSQQALGLLRPSEHRTNIQLDSLKILISIGKQLFLLYDYEQADAFFRQGAKIADQLKLEEEEGSRETVALFYIQWGANYFKKQQYQAAAQAFELAKNRIATLPNYSSLQPMLLRFLARNALAQEELKAAERHIRKTQDLIERHFSDQANQRLETQVVLGDIFSAQGDYQKALEAYQAVLHFLFPNFAVHQSPANPKLEQITHSKNKILELLQKKADALQKINEPIAAQETYALAIQLFHTIRQDYLTEDARLFLSGQMIPLFEAAIDQAIGLQEIELAFQYVEQSKALSLFEAINEKEAYALAGIPDSLADRALQLKIRHTHWEKMQYEHQLNGDSIQAKSAEENLFGIKREQDLLREQFDIQFPFFSELKFEKSNVPIQEIRNQLLSPSSVLIEYFITQKNVFLFGISADSILVEKIPKLPGFEDSISSLLEAFHQSPLSSPTTFSQEAFLVYSRYLAPILHRFPSTIAELYIIPDGLFNYLPFEALLTAPVDSASGVYSAFPFLIKKYVCSYAYSSALLLSASHVAEKQGKGFVGFAPVFDYYDEQNEKDQQLAPLVNSLEAITSIQSLTGGTNYTHQDATKKNLLQLKRIPQILHLSTHATMDDQNPMGSKIYLSDDDLTTKEIYNLPYSTELVVLSACETGSGKFYRGEGIMSLARAFMQSGSPSVVTSLWKVDDRSTSELMQIFYQKLLEGLPKNQALHQAKLEYLKSKSSESLHHPYYWTPFIHIGNVEAVEFAKRFSAWWFAGLALGLLVIVYFGWKIK